MLTQVIIHLFGIFWPSPNGLILGDPGAVSGDETRIGTGLKFSSKARRAPGNIPLTDEFQSELNSDCLIGRKFPQLSCFRPIREPHTKRSDHDSLYQVINATSTVAIFFYRSPCLARKTDIPCGENLGRKRTRKIQNSTNSTQKIFLGKGNYLYMFKIKKLGQNIFEGPPRTIAREGTSRVFVFCFLNITVAN